MARESARIWAWDVDSGSRRLWITGWSPSSRWRPSDSGYTSFWFNDIPHAEGLASVAAAAEVTTAIPLAVGVIPLDARPPAAISERITSLGVPRERLWLGVGSGHGPHALARVRTGVGELLGVAAKVIVGALGPKMAAVAVQTPTVCSSTG